VGCLRVLLLVCVSAAGCAGTGEGAGCTGAGCDLAAPGGGDGGMDDLGDSDLSKTFMATTIRAIDTGVVPSGTNVSLTGVVMTTPISTRTATGGCTYRAWVQDPAGAAPSGIDIFYFLQIPSACPAPGGPFAGRAQGDNVNVKGKLFVNNYSGDAGVAIIEHSIAVEAFGGVTAAGTSLTITPLQLNDPAQFAAYAPGYQAYEGMLLSLGCATGVACGTDGNKLLVKYQPAPYLFGLTGGALGGTAFSAFYPGKPGANGTAYTRMIGVANTFLTGSLEPRGPSDFVP